MVRMKLEECKIEPADIYWENIGLSYWEKFYRNFIFFLVVMAVSMISFALI